MVGNVFELGYQPETERPFSEWAYDAIKLRDSPYGEHFILEETPWLIAPACTLRDGTIQECVLMCCAQGGKTVFLHVSLIDALEHRPGPVMFVAQTIDAAKEQAKGRILTMIEGNPALAALLPEGKKRHDRSWKQTLFPNATLLIGPANDTFLRSHTIQHLFGDECSAWEPGAMEKARARTTRVWNRKHFFASTPLESGSEFEQAFNSGTQERYHLAAPCCGELVYLTSENLEKLFTWEGKEAGGAGNDEATSKNATTLPQLSEKPVGDGQKPQPQPEGVRLQPKQEEVDWTALKGSVRMVCPKCGASHENTEANYRAMIKGARYVAGNPKAAKELRSYAFNVLCLPANVFPWGKIVELWLKAKAEELRGNLAPLKEFITLRLAEPWNERKFLSVKLPNFEAYEPTAEWPEEKFRSLTVDCQEHLAEFHCSARAWGGNGASRLLDARTVHTEAEIKELQIKWNVRSHLVGLDCAYKPYEVYEMCVRNGWCAMRGDDREDWLHVLDDNGRKVRRPYSPPGRGDPRSGKSYGGRNFCVVWGWSNPVIKDLLWRLKEGRGVPWLVRDLGPEMSETYARGLDSERKREEIDRFGRTVLRWKKIRANHFWDAECMQVVFAYMAKLFVFGSGETEAAPALAA